MRYCNSGLINYERAEIYIISKDGDRYPCRPATSTLDREFFDIGAVSPRSLKKNITVPFSTETIKILTSELNILTMCDDRSWFALERTLDEIAGFANNYVEIGKVRDKIVDEFVNTCSDANCFLIHRKTVEYACHSHSEKVMNYITYNLVKMVENKTIDVNFYRLPAEDLKELLMEDTLRVENEEHLVRVIKAWIDTDSYEREKFRYFLMSSIRKAGISPLNISNYAFFELSKEPKRRPRDALLLLGGWNTSQKPLDCIEFLSLETSTWQRSKLKLPRPLGYCGAVMIDQTLYVFGGTDGYRFVSKTWKISPPKFIWIECDVMYEPRNYIANSCVTFGGKIYVFGGKDDRSIHLRHRSSTAECYDPKVDKWSKISSMLEERSECAAAVHRNLIYICGGNNGRALLSTVEIYNPQGDFYVPIQDLPFPISGHSMMSHRDQLCVVGGFDTVNRLNKILVWNENNSWIEQKERIRVGRSTFSACSYQGCIVIPGGYATSGVEGSWERVMASDFTKIAPIGNLLNRKSASKSIVAHNWMDHLNAIGMKQVENLQQVPIIIDNGTESMDQS